MVILLKGLILPIGGVAGRVCACSLRSRLVQIVSHLSSHLGQASHRKLVEFVPPFPCIVLLTQNLTKSVLVRT